MENYNIKAPVSNDNALQKRIDHWLFEVVLSHWLEEGFDTETGVAVECLNLSGEAMTTLPRRGRVAPRQLFSFARAHRLGFSDTRKVKRTLRQGAETLLNVSYCIDHGFPSEIDSHGNPKKFGDFLYDHAFVALAGTELEAINIEQGKTLSDLAFKRIDANFRDPLYGGYHSRAHTQGPKLANPHMHLLEASLLHTTETGCQKSKGRIQEICKLFKNHFLIDSDDRYFVTEMRKTDFSATDESWVEPGHCYEWAYLLNRAGAALDDQSLSDLARLLFESSEQFVQADGLIADRVVCYPSTHRLWPQLERLRCLTVFQHKESAAQLLQTIAAVYLDKGPYAGWVDKVDSKRQPLSKQVPASMLYHLMTALPKVTRPT